MSYHILHNALATLLIFIPLNSMAPSVERFLSISCTNVGVGPGGTTNLLAYKHSLLFFVRVPC